MGPHALPGHDRRFPLHRSLIVRKGYLLALTVPTWAPTLAVGMDRKDGWRASRAVDGCDDTKAQTAAQTLKASTMFPLPLPHGAADLHRQDHHDAVGPTAAYSRSLVEH